MDEKTIQADDSKLDIPDERLDEVHNMVRKHEDMWSGQLGDIEVTEISIDLVPGAKPCNSALYRAGTKTREFEKAEIDKQIAVGVIEYDVSGWEAPVLLVLRRD